jgi:tyrosinase
MPIEVLRERTRRLFLEAPARPRGVAAPSGPAFSQFVPEAMEQVNQLVSSFSELAEARRGDEGLEAVLDAAESTARRYDPELVRWALTLFITHHVEGRRLPIPSLEEADPHLLVPSPRPRRPRTAAPRAPVEADLNWFREDPAASDHHRHWHAVWPWSGFNDVVKARQGELFFYMHQQMLARYDTERVSIGLEPVQPLSDFDAELEPYDPGPAFTDPPLGKQRFAARGPGRRLRESEYAGSLEVWWQRLQAAADSGQLAPPNGDPVEVTADTLGAATESSLDSVTGPSEEGFFGSLHNYGHVALQGLRDGSDPRVTGVVGSVQTAIRDPVFYRWHRLVDDVLAAWQDTQPEPDFSDRPDVLLRDIDVILALEESIEGAADPDFDGAAFGEATFGGGNWDTDFSDGGSGGPATGELITEMLTRTIVQWDGTEAEIEYLDQRPFLYFIRAENRSEDPVDVTVRIFLAAAQKSDDRRWWMEMDKFSHQLPPGRSVLFRRAADSAVIRTSPKPTEPITHTGTEDEDSTSYCQCGWPYNLLLPRGTSDGMPFRLMVMFTDGVLDLPPETHRCSGSMSFCGLRDAVYPDRRPMGYPFERPYRNGTIAEAIAAEDHMAVRDITIRLLTS